MKYLTLFAFFFLSLTAFSQEIPPIINYQSKDYGAENQNWSISQSDSKTIYVANNKGLLSFDGARWKLYNSPNESILRSVKSFKNKIYTGSFRDFGFWEKNNFGNLEYTSLVQSKKVVMLEDEQIWNIVEQDNWIIFKSLERIFLYNLENSELRIISAENRITKLSKVNGVIYFQDFTKGIFKIDRGVPKLISNNSLASDNIIVQFFIKGNNLVFLTEEKGFFELKKGKIEKLEMPINKFLSKAKVYSAKQLKNKDIIIGTVSNGVFNISNKGTLNYKISRTSGLNNNTVLDIFEDFDENIWLALDNGITNINNKSAFKFYKKTSDYLGTVYASAVYQNKLYLGTNQGLFYKNLYKDESFKFIKNTNGQVWSLTIIDNELFCGHDSGAFIIQNGIANKIYTSKGTWGFKKIKDNFIIQGSYNGLFVLEKLNNSWKFRNKLQGFDISSRDFVIADKETIFVNHEYKGVYKLKIDLNLHKVLSFRKEESADKDVHSSILKYKNEILFSNKNGIYKYDFKASSFKKDKALSKLTSLGEYVSGKLINTSSNDKLWSFNYSSINYLSPGKLSSEPIITNISIPEYLRKGATGYENIKEISKDNYLVGTIDGYFTLDISSLTKPIDFPININQIKVFKRGNAYENVDLTKPLSLENEKNNLEFYFNVTNFDKIKNTKYQYKLEGFNKDWSSFSSESFVLFDNIPFGNYTFKVKAVIGEKESENIASFKFSINRPWYLSYLMIGIYFLSGLALIYFSHLKSKRYYKDQKQKLLEQTRKEAELKELENSQKIIKLNNDKLRSDIDSKNKELASSTMNLIKKNEFLNTIKKELKTGDEKSIKKVINIIDKDLNNTDDWKMFQEAFNNADKKFLKKLKSKHPSLTPNDLRLCAYLRLNLSSKEIAPLLNISPKSVEVKRYRLRKKLNLEHDDNLTNYILEV